MTVAAARQRIEELRAEVDQLKNAVIAHDRVWRGVAWLIHDLSVTPDEAHDLIWRESMDTNTRVADIAERIVAEHEQQVNGK